MPENQNLKCVFHDICKNCPHLELDTVCIVMESGYDTWNKYTISCKHFDACTWAFECGVNGEET